MLDGLLDRRSFRSGAVYIHRAHAHSDLETKTNNTARADKTKQTNKKQNNNKQKQGGGGGYAGGGGGEGGGESQ